MCRPGRSRSSVRGRARARRGARRHPAPGAREQASRGARDDDLATPRAGRGFDHDRSGEVDQHGRPNVVDDRGADIDNESGDRRSEPDPVDRCPQTGIGGTAAGANDFDDGRGRHVDDSSDDDNDNTVTTDHLSGGDASPARAFPGQ